jgi:hypothetical protein
MNQAIKLPRAVKISLTIVCILLALALLAVGGFVGFDRIRHASFYQDARREFIIPGLSENFTPQGFDYLPEKDLYIMSGYMSDNTASRIYLVDQNYKSSAPILIKNPDGSDNKSHAYGISFYPGTDHVYLAGSGVIHRLSLPDLMDGDGEVTILEDLEVVMEPAYCTIRNDKMYVGSFYYPEHYETPAGERYITPAGDQNYALLAVYALDPTTGSLLSGTHEALYSTCGMIQGMAFADDDTIIFSTSWGLGTSHLYCYDLTAVDTTQTGMYTMPDGTQTPLLFLDSASCYADIVAPCMSEELVVRNGYVYIMNEAACNKYFFGKLLGSQRLYSYPIPPKEAK